MQVRPQGQRYADPRRSRKRTEETRSAGRKKALPVLQALISSYRKIQKGTPQKEFLFFVSALGSFARWAPSLFSWTEAGRGPAPSLRLPALRARSGTAECRPAFSRGQGQSVLVAVQRRKRWSCGARNAYKYVSPVGRPAYSAGPKQVEDLHRAFGSRPFGQDQERRNADQHSAEVKDRVSLSRSSGENAGRAEHETSIRAASAGSDNAAHRLPE